MLPVDLEAYLKLVSKYELECLELPDGTKITKKVHRTKEKKVKVPTIRDASKITDEQALSMFGNKVSLEDFSNFSLIPPPDRFQGK